MNRITMQEMLAQLLGLKASLDQLYEVLPRDDYYRIKQLLSEAEGILKKHQTG
ncbi:MAG: hypothetical protein KGH65_04200 [Candidatus Micrarchaeota archaeon]|nr:hypothetical protein [Candidatus Micrarchaeota archaeon]